MKNFNIDKHKKLGKITIKIGSGATPRGGKESYKNNGVSLIRSMNVYDSKFEYKDLAFIDENQAAKLNNVKVEKSDILLNITGASVARCCIVPDDILPARVNQHVSIVRINKFLAAPRYIQYCLVSPQYKELLLSIAQGGATREALTKEKIQEFQIPYPPLPTQRKIAAILSAYDDLIENNLRRITILEEMAQNLYREWFVKFRFPGHEHTRFVDSPLGRIPEGWEVSDIKQFGTVITGKTPSKANSKFYGNDIPFVKTPDMHHNLYILETSEYLSIAGAESQVKKMLPADSICVSCIGTIGVVSITTRECHTNQQINTVVLDNDMHREFLFFSLKNAKQVLENLGANGATMGNVNKGKFEALGVIKPSALILSKYHKIVKPIFTKILILSQKNQILHSTRDLLLPKLISGEVDVSELEINVPEEVTT